MALNTFNAIAGGDIRPCRFVQFASTGNNDSFTVVEGEATGPVVGISQEGSRRFPHEENSSDDLLAAKEGEQIAIFGQGSECLLELGGTVTAGSRLKSDGDGLGVAIGFDETGIVHYGDIALEDGVSGNRIRVQVLIGSYDTA